MDNLEEKNDEPKVVEYPKLHPVDVIVFTIIPFLWLGYLLYCLLLYMGMKPIHKQRHNNFSTFKHYDPYKNGYLAPYNKPGTAVWDSLHRK